jgi:hypothetical protein
MSRISPEDKCSLFCFSVDSYVENCQYTNMSLTGSEVSQIWGKFSQSKAADKMGFVICILRKNKRKCHIVCRCLLQSIISLFNLKYKDLKKVLQRPPSPCMSDFIVSG